MTLLIGGRAAYLTISGFSHSYWNDIIVVPVLLAWIETLFLLSRYPTWGFYILMFFRVAFDVVKVITLRLYSKFKNLDHKLPGPFLKKQFFG